MAVYTQTQRLLQIETTLGPDALLLAQIEGEEAISRPFRFDLELASPLMDVDAAELLRTPAAISFPLHDGSQRTIHGLFSRFSQTGKHEDLATYRAELVAWPWFLSLRRNNRIFQQTSILDIADEIFRFWGFTDFEFRCDDRPPRDYIVQYNESDLDFISRWLEAEGIFYYFEHSPDGHVLVLADSNSTVEPCPDIAEAWLLSDTAHEMDTINSLTREHAVHVGRVTLRAYDYLQPSLSLEASLEGDGLGEVYNYPGPFTSPDDGERYARYGLEAEEALREQIRGEGNCRWMVSGHSFNLLGHFNPSTNGEYIIVRVTHKLRTEGFRSGDPDEFEYQNSFQCIPSSVPYRPPRLTPWPVINGPQTAVVVGPDGEEVWTNEHGCIKVQFHWDREGNRNQDSSCWMRVATQWGGKGYGSVSIPRIGDEVLVTFLEGDPDNPLVAASVYNAERMPPFELPGAGIQMGMKSRSSPGGGGYNEITATDTKGKEKLTVHAQYDMGTTVEHDDTQTINNDRKITVEGAHTETIKKDTNITISEGNLAFSVADGTADISVKKAVEEKFDATQTTKVKEKISISSEEADIDIKAATEIKLEVGASSLLMKSDGTIKLKGVQVAIEGEKGVVGIKGDMAVKLRAAAVDVKGDQMVSIEAPQVMSDGTANNIVKGGMVMLNPA